MKPKGVTTQMKALDESFLMVVFTTLSTKQMKRNLIEKRRWLTKASIEMVMISHN